MKKRFLAMLVTICMIITLLPFTAFAAEEDLPDDTESEAITDDGYSFEASSGKLTVTTNEGTVNWRNDKAIGLQAIKSVDLAEGVTDIGQAAFALCMSLTEVTFPDSLQTIGVATFLSCHSLRDATLPDSLQAIGASAFSDCSSLTEVTLPGGLQTIGEQAFSDCSGLTEVTLPGGLQTIGEQAFSNCSGLTAFSVNAGNPNFESEDGVLYSKGKSTLLQYPVNKSGGSFAVPAGVTAIVGASFAGCETLTEVILPAGLKTIETEAFYNCVNLTNVTFPTGLESIGRGVFYKCSNLTKVVFPAGLETIDSSAFRSCTSLTILTFMGDTPPYIDPDGFAYISSPGTIIYPSGAGGYTKDWKNTVLDFSAWTLAPAYRLTVKNGTDTTNAGLYRENETVEITADTAPSGQVFDLWTTENGGSFADVSGAGTTFTMPAAHATVTANYKSDHMHSFGTDWKSDAASHWHECIANDGFKASEAAHSGGTANCHAKALCEICKAAYGELNPDNHDGKTEVKNAVAATEDREGYSGDTYCLGCSVKLETGHTIPKLDHTHTVIKAPGTSPKPTDKSGTSDLPKTGDNSNLFLWICLLFVSGGAVITLGFVYKRKKPRGK